MRTVPEFSIYAVDPGTTHSALVTLHGRSVVPTGIWDNELLALYLRDRPSDGAHLVIEKVESFGMAVGVEVFETVFWSGRFAEAWWNDGQRSFSRIGRKAVKLALCGTVKAKDANIRQALIDRYGGPACIKKGGPLAGIKSHLWSALAVAVTYQDQQGEQR
jgi:hypothetical protein